MIVAIDPGQTTGVAVFTDRTFASFEIEGRCNMYAWLRDMFDDTLVQGDRVICESFRISPGTAKLSPQYDALYLYGAAEMLTYTNNLLFVPQTPSEAKSFSTDAKLKYLGWYRPSLGGHQNDAARHLLRWLIVTVHDIELTNALGRMIDA